MKSNEIAKRFYRPDQQSHWLTKKQTRWLYEQACLEAQHALLEHGTPSADGEFTIDDETVIGWSIRVARNGCAKFSTKNLTAQHVKMRADEVAMIERGKEFVRTTLGTDFEKLFCTAEQIGIVFNVNEDVAQSWIDEVRAEREAEREKVSHDISDE